MKKKTVNTIQCVLIVLLTVLVGFSFTGSAIAFENVEVISDALGTPTFEVITDENAANEDTEYYKSEYPDIPSLIAAGKLMVEEVVAEGTVLLKNENNALPLKEGERNISVFGTTSADPVYSGTGSGKVDVKQAISFYTAFQEAGLNLNPVLTENYSGAWFTTPAYGEEYNPDIHFRRNVTVWAGEGASYISEVPGSLVSETAEDSFAKYGDAAIYIFGRIGGEGADLRINDSPDGYKGDYLHLSEKEMETLKGLKALKDQGVFRKIIVIINSASMVACDFLKDDAFGVDAALLAGNLGSTGTRAVGKILTGEVVPSGHVTDTIWMDNTMNPVNVVFGYREYQDSEKYNLISLGGSMFANEPTLNSYVVYQEGMYLGYRYAETRYEDYVASVENVGDYDYEKVVAYPFGYGISYTDFSYSDFSAKKIDSRTYELSVKVTNTGDTYTGKGVAQFYVSKPYGDYAKKNNIQVPSVELLEFGKTKALAPGESEVITVTVDEKYLASFDTFGSGSYVLMDGDYYNITAAANAHDAVNNVIVAKGLANDKMVGSGNKDLTAAFKMKLDTRSYAVSELTGNEITAMFDYVDINTYLLTNEAVSCTDGLINADGVAYQALILIEDELPLEAAKVILSWAKSGLPVLFVNNVQELVANDNVMKINTEAAHTTGSNFTDEELAAVVAEIKTLPNVMTVESEAEALPALQTLGVRPRVEYAEPNTVLLPVLRSTEEADYLYLYNYMYEDTENFRTVVSVDGCYEPFYLDTWSGEVSYVPNYAVKDGRTEIDVSIVPGETQLLVLRKENAPEEEFDFRTAIVETAIPLTGWSLTVDSFEPGEKIIRTEKNAETGVETTEVAYSTNHVTLEAGKLERLFPWKYLPAVGKEVSGIGSYTLSFIVSADDLADASRVLLRAGSFEGGTASVICNGQTVPVNMDSRTADLTGVVQPGENKLTVRVTSSLRNRMIEVGYDQGWNILKPEPANYGMTGSTELIIVRCYSGNE